IQSNGTDKFTNSLAWNLLDNSGNGGGDVRVDPQNPNNVYRVQLTFGANAIVRKSNDGGQTWTSVLTTGRLTAPLVPDPPNPARLLVGGGSLQESSNQGATWTGLNAPIAVTAIGLATFQGKFVADPDFDLVGDIQANTPDRDTIYVTDGDSVYVTKNHGLSW